MAKDNEEQSLRNYNNRKKRYKRIRNVILVVLVLVLAIVVAVYLFRLYNKHYQNYEVLQTTDNTGETIQGYLDYNGAVVKYSKDGATAIDANGNLIWNGSYQMNNPIVDSCGEYVVVADKGGQLLQIYNEDGVEGSITTLYDIVNVKIASQGVIAVLMEEKEDRYIFLYNVQGTVLVEKKTNVNNAGYPIDIALSNDGSKLGISYLSITQGELNSTIAFFNYGEVGQNYTDGFVGAFEFPDIVMPRVLFLDNNTVCVYKEDGFLIYAIEEIPGEPKEITLEENIQSILYSKKYIGAVLKSEGTSQRQLILYDMTGKKVLDRKLEFDYDTIYLADEEIIMYNNLSCLIMKTNGNEKFEYTFDSNIKAFYPINSLDRYFLINESAIDSILLIE